ncbi:hypothetical protein CJO09_06790 [Neopusillimonas maritima]|uniref:DUF488 domain-containing protein n=1 Tax=Neopusillimonas maritima TaxID=2026239 RepID=A0ABX9MYM6_9BURK|nr:hypothetical protein CJO09_06790 [Neopusillimonas maritima]
MTDVRIKRVYDEPAHTDGFRVLVDRLWPRGVRKEDLPCDVWCKVLAPSADLRRWFGHKADRWNEFRDAYQHELHASDQQAAIKNLGTQAGEAGYRRITLLYAARDPELNHAVILANVLRQVLIN